MALTAEQRKHVTQILDAFCDSRVPIAVRDKIVLQYRFKGNDVVLFEKRPVFKLPGRWVDIGVAKFSFDHADGLWRLQCADRNSKWHHYDPIDPARAFEELLTEVDRDPTGILWG